MRAARCEGTHVVRAGVAVSGIDIDILDRHAERFGRHLPRDLFHALTEIDRRKRDGELAIGVGVDQCLAGIAA